MGTILQLLFQRIGNAYLARCGALMLLAILGLPNAQAIPAFARQTGQTCVACHAGGQFPELTPYGRMFKMTAYTIGERVLPLAVMAVGTYARVENTSKSDYPEADFQKNNAAIFATASVFLGGKITDNIGVFSQTTFDHYAGQKGEDDASPGAWFGHSQMDNFDLRYADRFIGPGRDWVFGLSLNNNPSVSDPWNTAAAWMQYVPVPSPSAYQFIDGTTPYPGFGAGGNVAGITGYVYWKQRIYAELGTYWTANRAFSFLSAGLGDDETTKLQGHNNPYWRLAYTQEWGPNNLMVGATGMTAKVYDGGSDISDPNNLGRFRNLGFDVQYQYLLDPHTITVQAVYARQRQDYSANVLAAGIPQAFVDAEGNPLAAPNASDTTEVYRVKVSYIYQATYGGSIAFFDRRGTSNTLNQTSGYDPVTGLITSDPEGLLGAGAISSRVSGNLSGNPGMRGATFEVFWMPLRYLRLGAQYTAYSRFNGASSNYDGLGRNAQDNNSLLLYVWGAY